MSAGKGRKRYVDYTKDRSKPPCLTHGTSNSSDECKVLGEFCSKNAKSIPTKERGRDPTNRKKFNTQKYNNAISKSAVDKILLQGS